MSASPSDTSRREALLDQLRYLVTEIDALAPLLERLPPDVLTASLPGERSILATFAHLAALDREVYLGWLRQMTAGDEPTFEARDPDGTVRDVLGSALADVRSARTMLVSAFEHVAPDAWSRTAVFPDGERHDVGGLALAIAHHDAAELRRLAVRLHESHITDRTVDLPK